MESEIKAILSDAGFLAREIKFIKRNDGQTVDFTFDISCPSKNDWNTVLEALYINDKIKKADVEY